MHVGCPSVLRTDCGTENSHVAVIQPILRHEHADSLAGGNSHRYGKSSSNQVIKNKEHMQHIEDMHNHTQMPIFCDTAD